MPSKPHSPPLFLFFPQWCDAPLARCPPCQHQPALARLMSRLQGARAPRLLPGGWAQPSGRLPRVLPSAEAESSRRDFAAEVERNESGGRARCWETQAAPALHPSKAWCGLPAITSRQLRLAGLGVSQRTQVALGFCLDIEPSWSVQVLKVSPTRRRWCGLELRRIVQAATWLVCGYAIQRSSCGRDGGNSLVFLSLRWHSAALLDKDETSCTVWPKGVSSSQIALFWTPCKVTITHITLSVA